MHKSVWGITVGSFRLISQSIIFFTCWMLCFHVCATCGVLIRSNISDSLAGLLNEAKGLYNDALTAFGRGLDFDPAHVPSLVSMAVVLRRLGGQTSAVVRDFLTEALRLDTMNSSAWYNLGLLYKDEGGASAREAADCFEAATLLEETAPVEPFR